MLFFFCVLAVFVLRAEQVHQDFRAVVSLCYASPVLWPLGWLLTRLTNSNTLSRHFVRFGFCLNVVVEACLHFVLGPRLHALRHDIKLKRASDRQDSADTGANVFLATLFVFVIVCTHAGAQQWGGGKRNSSFHHKKNHQRFSIRHLFTLRTMNCLLRNLFCLWLVYFVFGWCVLLSLTITLSRWLRRRRSHCFPLRQKQEYEQHRRLSLGPEARHQGSTFSTSSPNRSTAKSTDVRV
jgi:hypothetical protein